MPLLYSSSLFVKWILFDYAAISELSPHDSERLLKLKVVLIEKARGKYMDREGATGYKHQLQM